MALQPMDACRWFALMLALLDPCSSCPVRLLSVQQTDGVLSIDAGAIAYLESQPPPIFLIPAVGTYRSGKSLALNRLMGLSAPYVTGFGVGHSQDTYTTGIVLTFRTARTH